MTKEEILIRSILGPIRGGVRTFACAVEITSRLLFEEDMAQDDILVTKHVYPEVARKTEKSYMAVARQLERMGNLCGTDSVRKNVTCTSENSCAISARPEICFSIWHFTAISTNLTTKYWKKIRNFFSGEKAEKRTKL